MIGDQRNEWCRYYWVSVGATFTGPGIWTYRESLNAYGASVAFGPYLGAPGWWGLDSIHYLGWDTYFRVCRGYYFTECDVWLPQGPSYQNLGSLHGGLQIPTMPPPPELTFIRYSPTELIAPGCVSVIFDPDVDAADFTWTHDGSSGGTEYNWPNGGQACVSEDDPAAYGTYHISSARRSCMIIDGFENCGIPISSGSTCVIHPPVTFSVSGSPPSATVAYGESTQYSVSIIPQGSFSGPVALSVLGLPAGASAYFNPAMVSPGQSSTLTIATSSASGALGVFQLSIVGSVGAVVRSSTVELQIVQPPSPRVLFNGTDVTGTTSNVIVGQQISLAYSVNGVVQNVSWSVPGVTAGGYNANVQAAAAVPADFSGPAPVFYWVDGGSRVVAVTVIVNGVQGTANATFNVLAPQGYITPEALGAAAISIRILGNPPGSFATYGPVGGIGGVRFTRVYDMPAGYGGNFQWVQIVNATGGTRTVAATGEVQRNNCGPALDTTYPYSSNITTEDSPAQELLPGFSARTRSDTFMITVMFRPSLVNSIWVPLAKVDWSWGFSATSVDGGGTWSISSATPAGVLAASPTTSFPTWNSIITCPF